MNFDQMIETWKSQEEAPLYGVNSDLLQLVLQHEEADIRRALRIEQWVTYAVSAAMAAGAGFLIWAFMHNGEPLPYAAAAGVGAGAFVLWPVALWLSLRRQALRERGFGNSLREEIRRNLSLLEYQLSRAGRWSAATLWSAPVLVGTSLLYWLIAEINDNTELLYDISMIVFIVGSVVWSALDTSRRTKQELEPRRQRLGELLDMLDANE